MQNDNSLDFSFMATGESLSHDGRLSERPSDEAIWYPAEASGILVTGSGKQASVEFLLADDCLRRIQELGSEYRGEGIYLLSDVLLQRMKGEDNRIPFWVVTNQQSLTVGHVRQILGKISVMISARQYDTESYWSLES